MLLALRIDAHRRKYMVCTELDTVDVDHQQIPRVEPSLHQLLQHTLTRLDRLSAHCGLAHAHRVGHLRYHLAVLSRAYARHQDLEHPVRERARPLHRRIRWHFDLGPLAIALASEPGSLDADLAIRQIHRAVLASVPPGVIRAPSSACLLRTRDRFGTHLQHRLDRCSAHHLDHRVDRELRSIYQLDHRQQELALSLQELRDRSPIRSVRYFVRFLHWW